MSIIDRVSDHYRSLDRGRIEVPEWGEGDGPLIVTWTDFTLQEHSALSKLAGGDNFRLACHAIERNARNEAGERLFAGGDALKLMRGADRRVVLRIASAMLDVGTLEDAEKN
jgi:hypothetical protein